VSGELWDDFEEPAKKRVGSLAAGIAAAITVRPDAPRGARGGDGITASLGAGASGLRPLLAILGLRRLPGGTIESRLARPAWRPRNGNTLIR